MRIVGNWSLIPAEGQFKRARFKLLEDLPITDHRGITHTIPAGFITDYHSIPALMQSFFPVIDEAPEAAILHDWGIAESLDRAMLDNDYRKNLKHFGSPYWVQWSKWAGVRVGSFLHWIRN